MRTLQEKYNAVLEGNYSKAEFVRDARMSQPQFITQYNGYDAAVQILKNKGMIAEAKAQEPKYSTAKPEDTIAPDVLDTGIKFELDKKYGTLDVTDEQYAKCREMAIKNLANDVLYYVKQDSIQLATPGEKMEKAKLNEGFFDRFKKKPTAAPAKGTKVLSPEEIDAEIAKDGIENVLSSASAEVYSLKNATEKQVLQFLPVVAKIENHDNSRDIIIANALRPIKAYQKFADKFEKGVNFDWHFEKSNEEISKEEISKEETGPTGIALSQKQMDQLHDKGAVMVQVTVKDSDGSIRTVDYPLSYLGYEKDIDDTEDSSLEEQAESLQSIGEKLDKELKALGLNTRVYGGKTDVPMDAKAQIEKNPNLAALAYWKGKGFLSGKDEESLEVIIHNDHLEDVKKIASSLGLPNRSILSGMGNRNLLRIKLDTDTEDNKEQQLKELFKKIIAKVITE